MTNKPFPEYKKQNHRKVDWSQKRPVHGFDTETFMGKAILIADEKTYIEPSSIEDVLEFLTRGRTRIANNFFYNIKFDHAAMMKWLPNDLFEELILTNKLIYGDYKIRYLEGKVLSITKSKHVSEFYDLTNFYQGSLKTNMEKYLDIRKFDNVDAGLINSSWGYYDRNRTEIIKYCLEDSLGTKQLGELLQENYYKTIGIYPKKYISTANITAHYYKTKCYIPSSNKIMKETPEVMQYYWKAYMGGRFEVFRKGYFKGPIYDYDLKSAYPRTISELININLGEWRKTTILNREAYYGVYKCLVSMDTQNVMPFGFKSDGRTMYPQRIDRKEIYLTKKEIFAYGNEAKIEIIDGWEYFPQTIIKPFDGIVKKTFKTKERIKKEFGKESSEYDVIKKTLNTFYGKTIEVNKDTGETAPYWNPIYGAEITCECRIKVYQQAKAAGDSLISIETDGVWTDKKIPGIRLGEGLGEWSVDEHPWLYLIGGGQFASEGVLKSRGLPHKSAPILDFAKKHPNEKEVTIKRNRPVGMKEALILKRTSLSDINTWKNFTNTVSCNSSRERNWHRNDFTFGELKEANFTSDPWPYKILYGSP